MGCCLSTKTTSRRVPVPDRPDEAGHFHARSLAPEPEHTHVGKTHDRDPPLKSPGVEEESVKEVLSETPICRPQEHKVVMLDMNAHLPSSGLRAEAQEVSETCQISETCEISESFSVSTTATTTTAITEVREDDEEATSKPKREVGSTRARLNTPRKRPRSGDLAGRRERGGRPISQSPARNRMEARSARGREAGQLRTMHRAVGSTGTRRDVGEVSSRRSRSPAKRTVGGVNQEGMRRSPSKTTGRAGDRSLGVDVEGGGTNEVQNAAVLLAGNESLENPVVSLECFIFL